MISVLVERRFDLERMKYSRDDNEHSRLSEMTTRAGPEMWLGEYVLHMLSPRTVFHSRTRMH